MNQILKYKISKKLSDYYKNEGGIKSIFEFLAPIFNEGKNDIIIREANKIIIKVKYTFGNKEDEISFGIIKKELGLKNVLTNIDKSLKEINKDIIDSNEQFKKDLLGKVYPVGSFYWSERDNRPEDIFGGTWIKIKGRFLFASDPSHSVGKTGGEEKHQLTIDEMPSHRHGYIKIKYDCISSRKDGDCSYKACPCNDRTSDFYTNSTTDSIGGNNFHNNMPPYLTANCWKRIG